jgi:hypothetical protein
VICRATPSPRFDQGGGKRRAVMPAIYVPFEVTRSAIRWNAACGHVIDSLPTRNEPGVAPPASSVSNPRRRGLSRDALSLQTAGSPRQLAEMTVPNLPRE